MAGNTQYKNAWQKEHIERINLTVRKGQKEEIRTHAQAHSESINGFITRAILETMERDGEVDQIERYAKERGLPLEEAQRRIELHQAILLIESYIPGFKDFYDSGQIPKVISRKLEKVNSDGSCDYVY